MIKGHKLKPPGRIPWNWMDISADWSNAGPRTGDISFLSPRSLSRALFLSPFHNPYSSSL